ncbi:hypothetical protein CQA04_27490, partial [Escherichia coli]
PGNPLADAKGVRENTKPLIGPSEEMVNTMFGVKLVYEPGNPLADAKGVRENTKPLIGPSEEMVNTMFGV